MVNESVWQLLVKALDAADSAAHAKKTLTALLQQGGDKAPAAAARLAVLVAELKTKEGKQHALDVLQPYGPNVPECVELALALSKDDAHALRLSSASFLARIRTNPRAQARIFELIDDPNADVRNLAIQTVGQMDLRTGPEGAASALYVIPEEAQREEAIELLDRLERAVKTLQDLGLDDGQHQIVDELILPHIEELKQLFGAESSDVDEVIAERKRGMITLSGVVGSAQAFALGTTAVANADEAARTVKSAAQSLLPLLEVFKGLV